MVVGGEAASHKRVDGLATGALSGVGRGVNGLNVQVACAVDHIGAYIAAPMWVEQP